MRQAVAARAERHGAVNTACHAIVHGHVTMVITASVKWRHMFIGSWKQCHRRATGINVVMSPAREGDTANVK